MFIRIFIKIVPIFLVCYTFGSTIDSTKFYLDSGLLHEKQNNLMLSEQHYKKAIEFAENEYEIADIYNNIGIVYRKQGKYNLALDSYNKAKTISNDSTNLVKVYANIATIYKKKGDFNKALLYHKQALNIVSSQKWKALILNNVGNVLFLMNDFGSALSYYKESIELKKKYNPFYISSGYMNIALCFKELNKANDAELFFQKSIKERINSFGKNDSRLINSYINYGDFLKGRRPKKALNLLLKANTIAIYNYGKDDSRIAKTYYHLGNYYFVQKNYEKALENYQLALVLNSEKFTNSEHSQNPDLNDAISQLRQLDILHRKAVTLLHTSNLKKDIGMLNASLSTYELAIQILFKLQNSFMDESKRTLIADKKEMFAEAAHVAIQLGNYPKAFQLIEKGKASTLLAAINNNQAIKFSNIPDSLVELENEYKRLLFVHEANNNTDSILFYQTKHDSLVSYFERYYPKYHRLKYSSKLVNPIEHLDTNQVVLEYVLTDTVCTSLIISKEGYRHYSFTIDSLFYQKLDTYIGLLRDFDFDNNYIKQFNEYKESAFFLWKKLIKPLNIPGGKSLIIIPDGKLSYVSFEAFLSDTINVSQVQYYNLKYLIYKYPISYGYSSQLTFSNLHEADDIRAISFAPYYDDDSGYMHLKYNIPEAKIVTKTFKGKSFTGNRATKQNFLDNAEKYQVIHLAMHGVLNTDNQMNSYLVFKDDNLYTWEIYGMNLNARLIVLRACNTGDGLLVDGEGIMSIARAFTYSGCPTSLMSLWTTKDYIKQLVIDFYKELEQEKDLSVALRNAKINYLEEGMNANPHFWANMVIIGNTSSIKSQNTSIDMYLVIITFCIGIIIIFVLRKKIKIYINH